MFVTDFSAVFLLLMYKEVPVNATQDVQYYVDVSHNPEVISIVRILWYCKK